MTEVLLDEGVEIVISGKFGQNMIGALKSKGIKYKEVSDITLKKA